MKKNIKIGIIGHFGGTEKILDGQTIKTKILYDELDKVTDFEIIKVDTFYKNRKPLKLVFDTFKCLFKTKNVIVLLSGNGMKFYFPLLSFFSRKFGTRVYHDVIGGNLDEYVSKYPNFEKYLNSFQVNWVETEGLKKRLLEKNILNCEVMPNFKRLSIVDVKLLNNNFSEPFCFCIFSRVMKEKGIEDAIEAIETINKEAKKNICTLDIYGRIDDGYVKRFDEIMKCTTSAICYKGTVPYNKSVETIKDYYALLFPTHWRGEGFPGTIVDAFSAGIPVIATDWNCNSEILNNGVTGILYPDEEIKTLKEAIIYTIKNKDIIANMKMKCIETAKHYQPDLYVKRIIERIL